VCSMKYTSGSVQFGIVLVKCDLITKQLSEILRTLFVHGLIYPAVCSLFHSPCQRFVFFSFHFIILKLGFRRRNIKISFFSTYFSLLSTISLIRIRSTPPSIALRFVVYLYTARIH
jgi:hypothetical protein